MFSERPEGSLQPAKSLGTSFVGIIALVFSASGLVLYDATDGLTLGTLSDLCPQDANVLAKIRQADVPVTGDENSHHCSRSIIVKVRWDYGRDAYCVNALTFRPGSTEIAKVEPMLGQFAALKRIHMSGVSPDERERFAARFPRLKVSANRAGLWGGTARKGC